MGITQRPVGIGSRTSQKGGSLSMLQMPDGTFDRGNILCVASADWNGELSSFSNWGPGIVDVAAPGSNIVGTLPFNGYATENGTSFAAPMVAGVAAMVNSVLPNAQPWLVKCAILSSATSKPLRPADPTKLPFTYLTLPANGKEKIPYPDQSPLTVNGMVQASEAISAALFLV
jgi:subtilisin family serine protease